jgi:hypothetical protein
MANEIFGKKTAPANVVKNHKQTIRIRRFIDCPGSFFENESIAVLKSKIQIRIHIFLFIPSTK